MLCRLAEHVLQTATANAFTVADDGIFAESLLSASPAKVFFTRMVLSDVVLCSSGRDVVLMLSLVYRPQTSSAFRW